MFEENNENTKKHQNNVNDVVNVFIVKFEHISHLFLVLPLVTLNKQMLAGATDDDLPQIEALYSIRKLHEMTANVNSEYDSRNVVNLRKPAAGFKKKKKQF